MNIHIQTPTLADLGYLTWLARENGYRNIKPLPGRRWAAVFRFMFTDAIIVGRMGDETGYEDRWCFERGEAAAALEAWDGESEPTGWHRHPGSGRRRWGGDPGKEYIER